ncbi:hypothetical protein PR202_gb15094 [Eleusine coracana subsp. coracana]|uniref:Uncharacterized protein n=1 Tax=Eleusine coracana subsp. coracana TaxID=191504 RepID=A0AAV5EUN2_ELECO|nr:hypothetical protein PR202_gb15094 [Eleusine coracana subsp. coracana]
MAGSDDGRAVVCAGVSGLAAVCWLRKSGVNVTTSEAVDRAGGDYFLWDEGTNTRSLGSNFPNKKQYSKGLSVSKSLNVVECLIDSFVAGSGGDSESLFATAQAEESPCSAAELQKPTLGNLAL